MCVGRRARSRAPIVSLSRVHDPAPGTPPAAALAAERDRAGADIRARVRQAIARGDLAETTDVTGLASLILGFLAGISLRARDGENAAAIERGIDALMAAWDAHRPASGRRRGRGDRHC